MSDWLSDMIGDDLIAVYDGLYFTGKLIDDSSCPGAFSLECHPARTPLRPGGVGGFLNKEAPDS